MGNLFPTCRRRALWEICFPPVGEEHCGKFVSYLQEKSLMGSLFPTCRRALWETCFLPAVEEPYGRFVFHP